MGRDIVLGSSSLDQSGLLSSMFLHFSDELGKLAPGTIHSCGVKETNITLALVFVALQVMALTSASGDGWSGLRIPTWLSFLDKLN